MILLSNMKDFDGHLLFADGSSLGNPGPGGWGSVVVIRGAQVVELGGHEEHTTNNRMEVTGLIEGLNRLQEESGDVTIFTDSTYAHKGATLWAAGWKRRNWMTMARTEVENRDLWEILLPLLEKRKKVGHVTWKHVPGHSGVAGNERCDEIATGYAKNDEPGLFDGEIGDYAIDILNITIDEVALDKRKAGKERAKVKAYSYVSLLNGKVEVHKTWTDCEARVKGKRGAKFQKVASKEEEIALVAKWKAMA
jgi:ribonuclease HI